MTQRTIDETGKDVTERRGRQVAEVLFLRPDLKMDWVAEWLRKPYVEPDGWLRTGFMRTRNILDNES